MASESETIALALAISQDDGMWLYPLIAMAILVLGRIVSWILWYRTNKFP